MLLRKTHWAIDKVGGDMRRFAFNTAIAAVMELLNECSRLRELRREPRRCASRWRRRFAAVPVRAARLRRRVRAADRRARVGAPWPHADEELLETRRVRARLPGQRQGARPRAGGRRARARTSSRSCAGAAPNVQRAPRRQGDRQGDRGAREAREPRRALAIDAPPARRLESAAMAELKPAYLIHGDDHGAVGERRAGLQALAEGRTAAPRCWRASGRPRPARRRRWRR